MSNLITNPSFESNADGWQFDSGYWTRSDEEAYHGDWSIKLVGAAFDYSSFKTGNVDPIQLEDGKEYRLTFWVKGVLNNGGRPIVQINKDDPGYGGTIISENIDASADWYQMTLDFTADGTDHWIRLFNNGWSDGTDLTYYFDQFELYELVEGSKYQLEYKLKSGDTWVKVPEAAEHDSEAFRIKSSSNITDNDPTTRQLNIPSGKDSADFVAGKIVDTSNPPDAIELELGEFSEFEFSIEATDDAIVGEVYEFRVTDDGDPLEAYFEIPEIEIQSEFEVNSQRDIDLRGIVVDDSERGLSSRGVESTSNERGASAHGIDITSDTRGASSRGWDSDFNIRALESLGGDSANSNRIADSRGVESTSNDREAQALGSVTVDSQRGADTLGLDKEITLAELSARGFEGGFTTRGADAVGSITVGDNITVDVGGIDQAFSDRTFNVRGLESTTNSINLEVETWTPADSSINLEVIAVSREIPRIVADINVSGINSNINVSGMIASISEK